ncbi:hypothetical protein Goe9_c02250 [Bacillus phage vB_BsuM-Goe9]|nr:hypothetical protein Goe9_c00250 [Bacillus phage vB_BsuM-Goe9]QMV48528.1 hypothetical protein Goe9_c02250 [Bacillus phage vB_BsuM-Goe9]
MDKVCEKCGWLWNEQQVPITEDAINYCPVCDTVIPDNKEFLVTASTEGHKVEEVVMAVTHAEAYSKGVKITDPKMIALGCDGWVVRVTKK